MTEILCLHCQEKIEQKNENLNQFCCIGCQAAYQIINKIGLSNYYNVRKNDPNVRKIKPEFEEEINLENFIIENDSKKELFLAIDGIHCAACVWLIESILKKQKEVIFARVNLSKKYLQLKWLGSNSDGLKLVNLIREIGYKLFPFDEKILQKEEKKYNDELIKCLAVAGFAAGNVMLFSTILWFYDVNEIGEFARNFMYFYSALIALPAIIYSSRPFFYSAFKSLKSGFGNMDVAISVAIFLSSIVSLIEAFQGAKHVYFDSAIMLVFFLLIGRYLDFKARKKAFDIAKEFSLLNANCARIIDNNGLVKIIAGKNIIKDMILLVAAGDKIAADGEIVEGQSEIDSSLVDGESTPKLMNKGSKVYAGMINISASLKIKVLKNQDQSLIAQISQIVDEVENQKNSYIRLADKIAKYYTPAIHFIAFATFIFWYFIAKNNIENSLLNSIAVLIITCPCALALAVPITQTITISSLIKKGILTKSGEALEKIREIDIFIFDKTGTLTLGKPRITSFDAINRNLDKNEKEFYLKLAASLARNSKHPLSQAIDSSYDGTLFNLTTQEEKGLGLTAAYENEIVILGNKNFVKLKNDAPNQENQSLVYLKYKNDIIVFYLQDELKKDAKSLILKLKEDNKKIILLSGDNKNIVEKTAKDLAIEEFYFEKNPLEKIEILKKLKNKKIAMIGDGLNDAACLAFADVSISFLKASQISQNAADIIICNEKLNPILDLLYLAKRSILLIKQNLFLALCYNIIAIPFAIMGLITPLIAAFAMSSSSILVLLNSLRILNANSK